MVRHPHFTQPIFVRSPGRRCSAAARASSASPRRPSSPSPTRWRASSAGSTAGSTVEAVRDAIDGRREDDVRRALAATRRERPADAFAYFLACLGRRVGSEVLGVRRGIPAVKRAEDGYGG